MIDQEIQQVEQGAKAGAGIASTIGKQWSSIIMNALKQWRLIPQRQKEIQVQEPVEEVIGDVVTQSPARELTPQAIQVERPKFSYDNDYPVSLVHKDNRSSARNKKPLEVIEKPRGWVVVFQDKIAYQPKPGAWLSQSRPGPVLSEMLKQANQRFAVGQNEVQQVVVNGYDKGLVTQLSTYVDKQPKLSLQTTLPHQLTDQAPKVQISTIFGA